MYLVPIQVPIYLDGNRKLVTTEWHRSLELLRDSFNGRYGEITIVAPSLPANGASAEQKLVEVQENTEGLKLFPSFDLRIRARSFWLRERARWRSDVSILAERAAVVHAGLDDVYRPIGFEGYRIGLRFGRPTVFVQDTDIVLQQRELFGDKGLIPRARAAAYGFIYERMCRWAVARADLSLLKGSALMARYRAYAKSAKEFQDTSHSLTDVIRAEELDMRLATLSDPRPLHLVYCGRLTERKGVDQSLRIIARATSMGAVVEFDIIGDGAERARLQELAKTLGVDQRVRFLGSLPYGKTLLKKLSEYDGLLFTPTAEDTPRMIFDGYAAGLPVIGYDISYVLERHAQDKAVFLMPRNQIEKSAECLARLCSGVRQLEGLSRSARSGAEYHSSENWYRRRAEWTIEAVAQHDLHSRIAY